jgi:hypothetical protein
LFTKKFPFERFFSVTDEQNSVNQSESGSRVRPPSERAKRMEQKKAEKERRENQLAEEEEQQREKRRRAKQQAQRNDIPMAEQVSIVPETRPQTIDFTHLFNKGVQQQKAPMENAVIEKRSTKAPERAISEEEVITLSDSDDETPAQPASMQFPARSMNLVGQQFIQHEHGQRTHPHPTSEVYFVCFFCGQMLEGPIEFVNHMGNVS